MRLPTWIFWGKDLIYFFALDPVRIIGVMQHVNPKHVQSLVAFFESGITSPESKGCGIEIEHLVLANDTETASPYYSDLRIPDIIFRSYRDSRGVEGVLHKLRPFYDRNKEYWSEGHLLGLARDGIAISLEPGAQLECSLGIAHSVEELANLYAQFRSEIDPILTRIDARLVNFGYQPNSLAESIALIPKQRYWSMDAFFKAKGPSGIQMMRCTASTQVNFDYFSEEDCIVKLRVGEAIGPMLAWFFRNTPRFEGKKNTLPLRRQQIWDTVDPDRTGVTPGLYSQGYDWEDYARYMLETPLMTADLTHTPEYGDVRHGDVQHDGARKVFMASSQNASEIYPDRELNDYEIGHIISTHFNDVRLKNYIEMRHWDSLPIERAARLADIVLGIFYSSERLARLESVLSGIDADDVSAMKMEIQQRGAEAAPFGRSWDFWQDMLGVGDALANGSGKNVPGDRRHPELFQE